MYRAIVKIGKYNIGEEVPTEQAEIWLKAYKIPQVEKVDEEIEKPSEEKKEEKKLEASEKTTSGNPMLEDYLGRNANVVKKNVEEDDLSKEQLENLLELEKSSKKREVVIKAIKEKLNKKYG